MQLHSRFLQNILISAVVLGASGCVVVAPGSSGDVTFQWTFAGKQCFEVPGVSYVTIQIPGEVLENNGVAGCLNSNFSGKAYSSFAPGTYSFTISGQAQSGAVLYQASGRFTVDGDVIVSVDLQPTSSATGAAYITWTLPPGTTVTCQYLAAVDISIDQGPSQPVSCAAGGTSPGILLQDLPAGRHSIDLAARDSAGLVYYRTLSTFDVYAAGTPAYQYSLEWIVGSAPVKWAFSNGVTQLNCAQAGISEVGITLRNAQGDITFTSPCLNGGLQGYQVPYVYYGDYQVFLGARGTGGVIYQSSPSFPPTVTVVAGQFPSVDFPQFTPAILMTP